MRRFADLKGKQVFTAFLVLLISMVLALAAPCLSGEEMTKDPRAARQWITNGMIHFREGDFKKATECLERAIMFDPGNPDAQALLNEIMTIAVSELKSRGTASAEAGSTAPGAGRQADPVDESGRVASPVSMDDGPGFESLSKAAPVPVTREKRGKSLFGSFLGGRGRSASARNEASKPENAVAASQAGQNSLYASGSSFVSYKRNPRVSKAIESSMGGTGGFKLLSGYLEKPVDKSGSAASRLAAMGTPGERTVALADSGLADSSLKESRIEEYNEKGLALARKNRFGDAIRQFGGALELDPGNLVAMSNMALAYAYNDDLYSAIKVYRKIITLTSPGSKYHQHAKNMIDKLKTLI